MIGIAFFILEDAFYYLIKGFYYKFDKSLTYWNSWLEYKDGRVFKSAKIYWLVVVGWLSTLTFLNYVLTKA